MLVHDAVNSCKTFEQATASHVIPTDAESVQGLFPGTKISGDAAADVVQADAWATAVIEQLEFDSPIDHVYAAVHTNLAKVLQNGRFGTSVDSDHIGRKYNTIHHGLYVLNEQLGKPRLGWYYDDAFALHLTIKRKRDAHYQFKVSQDAKRRRTSF